MAMSNAVDGEERVPGHELEKTNFQLLEMFSEPLAGHLTSECLRLNSRTGLEHENNDLDIDKDEQFEISRLLQAFGDFGVNPSTSQLIELQNKLSVNDNNLVKFGNFVEVVKDVFHKELIENIKCHGLQLENSKLREEIIILKRQLNCMEKACSCIEDDLLTTRKELQYLIECIRKLKGNQMVEIDHKRETVADCEHVSNPCIHQESVVNTKKSNPDMCKENSCLKEEIRKLHTSSSVFKAISYKLLFFLEELQPKLVEILHTPRHKVGRSFSLYRNIACGNCTQCSTTHPRGSVARAASVSTPMKGDTSERQMKQIDYDTLYDMTRKMKDILMVSKEMLEIECHGRKDKEIKPQSINPLCFSNKPTYRNPLHDLPPKTTVTIMSRV